MRRLGAKPRSVMQKYVVGLKGFVQLIMASSDETLLKLRHYYAVQPWPSLS